MNQAPKNREEGQYGICMKTPIFGPTDEGELEIEFLATTPALYSTEILTERLFYISPICNRNLHPVSALR